MSMEEKQRRAMFANMRNPRGLPRSKTRRRKQLLKQIVKSKQVVKPDIFSITIKERDAYCISS